MAQYEIDVAALDAARGIPEKDFVKEPASKKTVSKIDKADLTLSAAIAKLLGLYPVKTSGIHGQAVLLCGDSASVAIGQELYAILRKTMFREANRTEQKPRKRAIYRRGFAAGIYSQVMEMEPSEQLNQKYEWNRNEAKESMNIVPLKQRYKKTTSLAFRAGAFKGLATNIDFKTNLPGAENEQRLLMGGE